MLDNFGEAIHLIMNWINILVILFGAMLGTIIGAIPGLTGVMTIALVLPLTMYMPTWSGISLIVAIYCSSNYGGSISAILLRTPGTPAAAVTVEDGYALNKKGQAKKALQVSLFASFSAGILSTILLLTLSPLLAIIALKFGPPEFTLLILFSMLIIGSVAKKSIVKGLISTVFGVLIGIIGLDPITTVPRFSFGAVNMMGGLNFMPLLIGLFAISECFFQIERYIKNNTSKTENSSIALERINQSEEGLSLRDLKSLIGVWFRSSLIGAFLGALPGIGSAVSPFIAYGYAKKSSKDPDKYGEGSLEGITAAEAANNGVTGANMIPLLSLGIPGDVVAAMLMGALMIHGIRPGPLLFQNTPQILYVFGIIFFLANISFFIVGSLFIKVIMKFAQLPTMIVVPFILPICLAGAYAFNRNTFDIKVMLIFGVIGYVMRKLEFSTPSFLIAFILSPILEVSFRRTLILSRGGLSIFINRPVSVILLALIVIVLIISIINTVRNMRQRKKETDTV